MKRLATILLLLSSVAFAGTLDSKSLYIGLGIGAGSVVTRNYVAIPIAKATKKAAQKTARATVHVVTLGKK
jgi:hypothetical protein